MNNRIVTIKDLREFFDSYKITKRYDVVESIDRSTVIVFVVLNWYDLYKKFKLKKFEKEAKQIIGVNILLKIVIL